MSFLRIFIREWKYHTRMKFSLWGKFICSAKWAFYIWQLRYLRGGTE